MVLLSGEAAAPRRVCAQDIQCRPRTWLQRFSPTSLSRELQPRATANLVRAACRACYGAHPRAPNAMRCERVQWSRSGMCWTVATALPFPSAPLPLASTRIALRSSKPPWIRIVPLDLSRLGRAGLGGGSARGGSPRGSTHGNFFWKDPQPSQANSNF